MYVLESVTQIHRLEAVVELYSTDYICHLKHTKVKGFS